MIELTQFQLNVLSDAYYALIEKIYDKLIVDAEEFKEINKAIELEQLANILTNFYRDILPNHVKRT